MGEHSAISWTDHTFNPWHGCTKIAHPNGSGCDHCYAETQSIRFGKRTLWGNDGDRRVVGEASWALPHKWNREAQAAGKPAFVFCASMGDVFEPRADLDVHRARLWALIDETPWLVWLLLTKRPENVAGPGRWLVPPEWIEEPGDWPRNVWVGTSVEHQAAAQLRIPRLLAVPAPRHFLSCEPLLGRVRIGRWVDRAQACGCGGLCDSSEPCPMRGNARLVDWVIVGGESGAGRRELDLRDLGAVIHQCENVKVPVWTKQDSGLHAGHQGRIPDDLWRHERPEPIAVVAA